MKQHVRWSAFVFLNFVVMASADHPADDVLVRLTGWDLRDECLFHNCHNEAACVPKDGGFSCVCNRGWTGDGWNCENLDECKAVRNICGENTHCTDTVGSYSCNCSSGFVEVGVAGGSDEHHAPPKLVCQDVDECVNGGKELCHPLATCENSPGSFDCLCPLGYYGDGVSRCADMCLPASPAQRINCSPDGDATELICRRRGCCWQPYQASTNSSSTARGDAAKKDVVPPCYYPLPVNTYELTDISETDSGLSGTLMCSGKMRAGDGTGGKGNRPYHIGPFGSEVCPLSLQVSFDSDDHLRIRIKDPAHNRWEVPENFFSRSVNSSKQGSPARDRKYILKYTSTPFGLAVVRAENGEVLFNSTPVVGQINGLTFEEQYLEFSTVLPHDPLIYGFGEQNAPFKLPTGQVHGLDVYTIFARDQFTPVHRAAGGTGLYGAHPFCLQISQESGLAHGLFVRNSNGMDVVLTQDSMTFRIIGGIIDVSLFLGSTSKDVLQQYTAIIGRPALPPVWALGFHLCRWGYESADDLAAVVDKMWDEDIPQDVQWSDIDYMDGFRDFTLDPVRYPQSSVRAFVDKLHKRGQRYVTIIDPGISIQKSEEDNYAPYQDGLGKNVFVRDHDGIPLEGSVWPGAVVFPDFGHPNASEYWTDQLTRFHDMVPVDGLWLDMNEPSNFCDGTCSLRRFGCRAWEGKGAAEEGVRGRWEGACAGGSLEVVEGHEVEEDEEERLRVVYAAWKLRSKGGRRFDPANPPYVPGGGNSLNTRTLSMTAKHCWSLPSGEGRRGETGEDECQQVLHYDAHNLYGLTETRVSAAALERIRGKRGLIISRSTFAGSGSSGGHWLGDNKSGWADLRASIAGILAMGLFGVPLVGADICGFRGDATRELCIRWTQVGAWYPFSRNHNEIRRRPQEPFAFDAEATALMRRALRARYRLLPYLYTAFYTAHLYGTPVARPIWMELTGTSPPGHAAAIDDQFFVGGALLVSPILEPGLDRRQAYFPAGPWFDLVSGAPLLRPSDEGEWVTVEAPLWHIPVHVRGGHIVPTQRAARTTAEVRRMPVTLIVAPDVAGRATGRLYMDDGEGLEPVPRRAYTLVHFASFRQADASRGNLSAAPTVMGYDPAADSGIGRAVVYEEVRILGVDPPRTGLRYMVLVNGAAIAEQSVSVEEERRMLRVRLDGSAVQPTEEQRDVDALASFIPLASATANSQEALAASGDKESQVRQGDKKTTWVDSMPQADQAATRHRPVQGDSASGAATSVGVTRGPSVMEVLTLDWMLVPSAQSVG